MPPKPRATDLKSAVQKIKASGALGRSPTYFRLLDHLANATESGEAHSETSLAIDIFNKDEGFDVTSDSTVRVYIHNLRQKLHAYYDSQGREDPIRLVIPKGSYRLVVKQQEETPVPKIPSTNKEQAYPLLLIALGAVIALFCAWAAGTLTKDQPQLDEPQLAFWGDILIDDKPVVIAIGDYYIFGEEFPDGHSRLVREFDINSPTDLQAMLESSEDSATRMYDMGLTYLPRGSAFALSQVQNLIAHSGKNPRISMMSELDAVDLQDSHLIYLGYVSGLGILEEYTFSASRFDVGFSYDELVDRESKNAYRSNLIDTREDRNFVDYGVLASYMSAAGNRIVVIAGTRDAGLMEMSEISADPLVWERMQLSTTEDASLISLFEVYGFNLTNISSSLIGSEFLDAAEIWSPNR